MPRRSPTMFQSSASAGTAAARPAATARAPSALSRHPERVVMVPLRTRRTPWRGPDAHRRRLRASRYLPNGENASGLRPNQGPAFLAALQQVRHAGLYHLHPFYQRRALDPVATHGVEGVAAGLEDDVHPALLEARDRKSTRLNTR